MKAHRLLIFSVLIMLAAFGSSGCNREDRGVEAANEAFTAADQQFTKDATMGHAMEIDMARMAKERSQNEEVRDYAEMVESDHTDALEDLMEIAEEKGITPSAIVPEKKQEIDRMANLYGVEFDREFMNTMVVNHKEALEKYRQSQGTTQNSDLGEHTKDLIPTIEKHLAKAQELQSKLFNGNKP